MKKEWIYLAITFVLGISIGITLAFLRETIGKF